MPDFINSVATADTYGPTVELAPAAWTKQITFSIIPATGQTAAAPVLATWAKYPADANGEPDLSKLPTYETIERIYIGNTVGAVSDKWAGGVKFRSAIAGSPATVVAERDFQNDIVVTAGNVSSASISSGGVVTPGGGFLGTFTPAGWPPAGPLNGQQAGYLDLGVEWVLEYQSGPNTWRYVGGNTAPVAVVTFANTSASTNFGSTVLGVGGSWQLTVYFTESSSGASGSAGLGSTSGAQDIIANASLTPGVGRFDATATKTYAAARGAPVFPNVSLAGGVTCPYLVVTFRPITLNNA